MTYVLISLSIIFWASSFVGIRATLQEYTPIELAVLRFMVASAFFLLLAFLKKIKIPAKKDGIHIILMGVLLFINLIVLNYGALTIQAGEISFILNTSPLFTALLAYLFLKESISIKFLIGLICCFLGVTLISLNVPSGFTYKPGIIFVLLASITYSSFFILQKPLLRRYSPLEITSYSIWIATVLMMPFGTSVFKTITSVSINSTVVVIYLGIFPTVISFLCWSVVLSKIDVSRAAVFLYIIPVITIAIAYIWLHEIPSLKSLFGGMIIITGVIITNMKSIDTEPLNSADAKGRAAD